MSATVAQRNRNICYYKINAAARNTMNLSDDQLAKLRRALTRVVERPPPTLTEAQAQSARACLLNFCAAVADPRNAVDPSMGETRRTGPLSFNLFITLCLPQSPQNRLDDAEISALAEILKQDGADGGIHLSARDFIDLLYDPHRAAAPAHVAVVALVGAIGHLLRANRLPFDDTLCKPCMRMFHFDSPPHMLNLLACAEGALTSDTGDRMWLLKTARSERANGLPALPPALPPQQQQQQSPVELADATADVVFDALVDYLNGGRTFKRARVVVDVDGDDAPVTVCQPLRPQPVRAPVPAIVIIRAPVTLCQPLRPLPVRAPVPATVIIRAPAGASRLA